MSRSTPPADSTRKPPEEKKEARRDRPAPEEVAAATQHDPLAYWKAAGTFRRLR